jgi:PhnB protein
MQSNPYLMFNGDCEAALNFYAQVLGGKVEFITRFEGTPAAKDVPADYKGKILHATFRLGDTVLMASDAPPQHYEKPQGFSININAKSAADAERIFQSLADKGRIQMPLEQTFWAERFGMLVDRYGIPWMVNYSKAGEQTGTSRDERVA